MLLIARFNFLFSLITTQIEKNYHILRSYIKEYSCNTQTFMPSKFLNQYFMPHGTSWAEDNK